MTLPMICRSLMHCAVDTRGTDRTGLFRIELGIVGIDGVLLVPLHDVLAGVSRYLVHVVV